MGSLRRYAYLQARIRARIAALLGRRDLERLASVREPAALERELAAAGWAAPDARPMEAFAWVLAHLDGPPRELVDRYRARHAMANLALLLRGVERGAAWDEVAPRLVPGVALGPGGAARRVLEAGSLSEAVARLDETPFGSVLRIHARAGEGEPDRFRLETVAEREVYERLWAGLDDLDAADRRAARRLVGMKLDCVNLLRTLRLRRYRGLAPEEVVAYGVVGGLHLGSAQRSALAHEPTERWPALLEATPYGPACGRVEPPEALEVALGRLLARAAERELSASPFQIGLVLAYLLLLELQARDVRGLRAGRRFGRSPQRVVEGLVTRRAA